MVDFFRRKAPISLFSVLSQFTGAFLSFTDSVLAVGFFDGKLFFVLCLGLSSGV